MSDTANIDYLIIDQKQQRALKCFWFGIICYTLGFSLFRVEVVTFKVAELLQLPGILLFVISSFFLIRFRFENNYLAVLYVLYAVWLLSVIARGFSFNSQYLMIMLLDDYGGIFPYFTPLILFFPQNILCYKKVFQVVTVLGILFLLLSILYIRDMVNRDITSPFSQVMADNFIEHFAIPSTFLIVTYSVQSKKIKYFSWFITALAIIFAVIRARRGWLFTTFTPILFAGFIYFNQSKRKVSIVVLSIISVVLIFFYGLTIFNQSSFFGSLRSRVDADTRSGVEKCFYNDMKLQDWVVGRGIDGEYYCPVNDPNNITGYRSLIETDYLNIILKGGLISMALLLLIMLPAAVKGIFYSKNNFSKAAGFWILIWTMNLYPTTVVTFNLNYLLLWMAIGICYNKRIRSIPDDLMKLYFSKLPGI